MEMTDTKPVMGSGVFAVPFSPRQLPACLLALLCGWLFWHPCTAAWSWLALAGVLTLWQLMAVRGRGATREHWLWLACLWASVLYLNGSIGGRLLPGGVKVWEESGLASFFPLLIAPYWVLCCGGLLTEGHSSGRVALDLVHALVIFPFRWFFLLPVRLWRAVAALGRRIAAGKKETLLYGLLTLLIALVFLWIALGLLRQADSGFRTMLDDLNRRLFRGTPDLTELYCFLMGLPVASYLYSLISGSREGVDRQTLLDRAQAADGELSRMKRLPLGCWLTVLAGFTALYLVFFRIQGATLLQTLRTRLAPGEQTMAAYAVEGFWQLVGLMVLTLALLLTARMTAARPPEGSMAGRVVLTCLLVTDLMFAASAAGKLWLYVSCFGLTPLRLRGAWAILVLSAGCVCAMIWVWTKKKTAGWWCAFTGAALLLSLLL